MVKNWLASSAIATVLLGFGAGSASAITLEEAVRLAVNNNPEVGAASANRDAILEELRQARALWLPRVDLEAGIGPEWTTRESYREDTKNGDWEDRIRKESAITIRQRIFDGFEADSETEREMARLESAALRVAERSELLGLDTVNAYLEIIRLQELLALAEQNVQVHVAILDQMRQRVAGGAGSEADVTQTETRLSRARVTVSETRQQLQETQAAYARLTGQLPDSVQLPTLDQSLMPANLADAEAVASRNNPTLKIFEADVKTAEAIVGLAESEFWPEVFLEGRSELNDEIDGNDEWESQHQVMLRLRWNLYSGGRDTANRREALHRLNEAKMFRYSTHLNAREEMRRSWYFLEGAESKIIDLTQAAETNLVTRDAYVDQFNIGQRTLLDVLDSENELFNTRSQLVSATNNALFAKYRILAVAGHLLDTLGIRPPDQADGAAPSFSEQVFE